MYNSKKDEDNKDDNNVLGGFDFSAIEELDPSLSIFNYKVT